MASQRDQLRDLYGFDFPDDLFGVFSLAQSLCAEDEDPLMAFHEQLGIKLTGPFDVLAGCFDDVTLRYSPLLHQRYASDLPEFFTVFVSPETEQHWGYWFDAPGAAEPFVAAYSTALGHDGFLSVVGFELFEALRSQLEWFDEEAEQALVQGAETLDTKEQEALIETREALAALRKALLPHAPGTLTGSAYIHSFAELTVERGHVVPSNEGVGVAVDEALYEPLMLEGRSLPEMTLEDIPALEQLAFSMLGRGLPGAALLLGRELWRVEAHAAARYALLEQAYQDLERPVLAQVCEAMRTTPLLLDPNILSYKSGDYLDLAEALSQPAAVHKLEIGGQWLGALPEEIGTLENMVYLDVWGNQLYDLPDALKGCTSLQTILMHLNAFEVLPSVLGGLPGLEVLIAARSSIAAIGDWFGRCTSLKHLDLHQNKLSAASSSLSPSLFSLQGLEVLSLAENKLTSLPAAIGGLVGLQRLDLQGNALQSIPQELTTLTKLVHLDLQENQIEALPDDLSGWVGLARLLLQGNPISPSEKNRIKAALPGVEVT